VNKTNIDWPGLTHTWNPGYGCKRNCKGFKCYAKDLHDKRRKAKLAGADLPDRYLQTFDTMQFFPPSLKIPKKSRIIKKVFVGSMTGIEYWDPEWVEMVLEVIRERPTIEFMFCTKNPGVYWRHEWPKNCWLGVTLNYRKNYHKIHEIPPVTKRFVSIEPLLEKFNLSYCFPMIDLIIIGADSTPGAQPPKKEWIESIKHHNIHYKKSIRDIYPEFKNKEIS